jgi:hypothetical protein
MTLMTRLILIFLLLASLTTLRAQETTPAAPAANKAAPAASAAQTPSAPPAAEAPQPVSSYDTRTQFSQLLRESAPDVALMLALDPTLLSDEAFLARYPVVARFVASHPEVRHNSRFYLAEFENRRNPVDELLEPIMVVLVGALMVFAAAWLIRTLIEQKRWNRLAQTQSEVHGRILDRFGTSAELLEYIRTPAGARFLESAPIPVREERTPNGYVSRTMWSIQLGVIVVAAAIGMLIVSARLDGDGAKTLSAMGVIAFSVGVGFIASAVVSMFLSRRLGVWQGGDIALVRGSEG